MSSTLFRLCVCSMVWASDEEATRAAGTQTKSQAALLCMDGRSVYHLRKRLQKARDLQRFRQTQLRRYRQLNEACLGSYQKLVEESEQRLLEADLLVVRSERCLRFWGVVLNRE